MSRSSVVECPSGLKVLLRSIKGKDLDLLRDKRRLATGEALHELLNNCTIEVQDRGIYTQPNFDWADVLIGDRMVAVVGLRTATSGEEFSFKMRCQDRTCREQISWELNLRDLPQKPLSDASREVYLHGNQFQTEIDGKVVTFGLRTGRDNIKLVKMLERMRSQEPKNAQRNSTAEKATLGLMARITSVEGVDDILAWLDDIDLIDISKLTTAMDEVDCGIDTEIAVECSKCSLRQQVDLPLDNTFFA